MKPEPVDRRDLMIPLLVTVLLVWGLLLALGAYLFRGEFDIRKPIIILACVGTFVGFWGLMLWVNRNRFNRS